MGILFILHFLGEGVLDEMAAHTPVHFPSPLSCRVAQGQWRWHEGMASRAESVHRTPTFGSSPLQEKLKWILVLPQAPEVRAIEG